MQDKNPFEDFINGRYAEDAAEQLKHIVKTFERPEAEYGDQWFGDGKAQVNSQPAENGINYRVRIAVDTGKLRASLAKLDPDTVERAKRAIDETMQRLSREALAKAYGVPLGDAGTVRPMTVEDLRRAQVECYIARYGLDRVTEAETFAAENGIELYEALRLFEMRDAINAAGNALRQIAERAAAFMQSPAVQDALKELGAQIGERMAEGIEQRPEPSNRHERRAQRHRKPMKDGDQLWKTRQRYRDRR